MTPGFAVGFCMALMLANLIVLGLNVKLYTEIFKARDKDNR